MVQPQPVGSQVLDSDVEAEAEGLVSKVLEKPTVIQQQARPSGLPRAVTMVLFGLVAAVLGMLILVAIQQSKSDQAQMKLAEQIHSEVAKNSQAQMNLAGAVEHIKSEVAAVTRSAANPASEVAGPAEAAKTLDDILAVSGSDKARPGMGAGHHGYTRYYDLLFKPLRDSPVRFVEIGVDKGQSLKAWQQYFTNADHIYGIGYGNFQTTPSQPCSSASATKTGGSTPCTLFKGDQSDVAFLERFLEETKGDFDIIIDDGSHVPGHQILTFENLWRSVRPGGLYIVEDIETNWWLPSAEVYGYKIGNESNAVRKWRGVIDAVNREYTRGRSPLTDKLPDVYGEIVSVEFGQNIVIFRKALRGEAAILARQPYRFQPEASRGGP